MSTMPEEIWAFEERDWNGDEKPTGWIKGSAEPDDDCTRYVRADRYAERAKELADRMIGSPLKIQVFTGVYEFLRSLAKELQNG